MKARVKNYTSQVPVERSVNIVEHNLVEAGASDILKFYRDGELAGMMFKMNGETYKMPTKVDAVEKFLREKMKKPRPETLRRIREQAARTAWKVLSDWVEIQITFVNLGQAEAVQVFLAYAWNPKTNKTLYQTLVDGGFKQLAFDGDGGKKR